MYVNFKGIEGSYIATKESGSNFTILYCISKASGDPN